jgi:photosystem II stability/assembly factor-like uncharacterized protein
MKKHTLHILGLFLYLSICFSYKAFSQGLNNISSPDGNFVIAAGDAGKIVYSTNSGTRWYISTAVVSDFKSVFSLGNIVWIAGGNGNIYSSSVSSINFIPHSTGNSGQMNGVCFVNSSTGYTCSADGKIYKSVNAGVNWVQQYSAAQSLNSISFKDDINGVCVGNSGVIIETTNGGASWQAVTSGTTRNLLKTKYFSSGYITVGEYGTLLSKSLSITSVNSKIITDIRGVSGISFSDAHICGGGGFIRNNKNNNVEFTNFEINPSLQNLVDIFFSDAINGWAVSNLNDCVIRTTNGGASWSNTGNVTVTSVWENKLGQLTTNSHGNGLCKHPYNSTSYFVGFENKIYVSRNKGDNWSLISTYSAEIPLPPNGTFANNFFVSRLDTNIWLSAIQSIPYDKILRTTNYGANWNIVKDSVIIGDFANPLEEDIKIPGTYYFANDNGGFYKSSNNGASFVQVSTQSFNIPCDVLAMPDTNVFFIANANYFDSTSILKSTNGGVNWSISKKFGAGEIPFLSASVFEKKTVYAANLGGKVNKTSNLGEQWADLPSVNGPWALAVSEEDPSFLNFGRLDNQSYYSTNYGETYTTVNFTSGSFSLNSILAPERDIILGYFYRGIYKVKFAYNVTIDVKNISTQIPDKFLLSQNYPNPFNPNTNIRFAVIKSGFVKLKVFDALGKEVKNLVNENLQAGEYEVNFEGNGLNTGVYFYTLESGSFTETKKMILIK